MLFCVSVCMFSPEIVFWQVISMNFSSALCLNRGGTVLSIVSYLMVFHLYVTRVQLASSPPCSCQDVLGSYSLGRLHLLFCWNKMENKFNTSPLMLSPVRHRLSVSIIHTSPELYTHTLPSLLGLWKILDSL